MCFLIAEVDGATPAEGTFDGLQAVEVAMGVERSGIGIRVASFLENLVIFEARILSPTPPARLDSRTSGGFRGDPFTHTDFDFTCLVSRRGHLPGSAANSDEGAEANSEASASMANGWYLFPLVRFGGCFLIKFASVALCGVGCRAGAIPIAMTAAGLRSWPGDASIMAFTAGLGFGHCAARCPHFPHLKHGLSALLFCGWGQLAVE